MLAAKQKEDDNLALQKYTRADEVKIKELNLTIEKLTQGVMDHKVRAPPSPPRDIVLSLHFELQTV